MLRRRLRDVEVVVARRMGLQIEVFNRRQQVARSVRPSRSLRACAAQRALFAGSDGSSLAGEVELALLAAFHRSLRSMRLEKIAEAGGLMSYGTNIR